MIDEDEKYKLSTSTTSDLIAELNKVSDNLYKEVEDMESIMSNELNEKLSFDENTDNNGENSTTYLNVIQEHTDEDLS